jgi:hypothetical protein
MKKETIQLGDSINIRQEFVMKLKGAFDLLKVPVRERASWLSRNMSISSKSASKWLTGENLPLIEKWETLAVELQQGKSYFYPNNDYQPPEIPQKFIPLLNRLRKASDKEITHIEKYLDLYLDD